MTLSDENDGSIEIAGICRLRDEPATELALDLFDPASTAAIADRCHLRKLPIDSKEGLGCGVAGLDGSGFVTRNRPGPTDSRKLSECAKGRGQCSRLTRINPPSRSGVLARESAGGGLAMVVVVVK